MKRLPALCLLFLVVACGYQVPGQQTAWVGLDHRLLYVEFFVNHTAEPYLDHFLTEAVTRQLANSRQFELTEDRRAADLVLTGSAVRFASRPSAYDGRDRIAEYEAVLEIRARLVTNGDGRVLWQEELVRRENYPAADDKNRQLEFRSRAAELAAARLAEDLQARLLDAF